MCIDTLFVDTAVPTKNTTYTNMRTSSSLYKKLAFKHKLSVAITAFAEMLAMSVDGHGLCSKRPSTTTLPSHHACHTLT